MAVTEEIIRSSDVSVDDELTKVPAYHVCFWANSAFKDSSSNLL